MTVDPEEVVSWRCGFCGALTEGRSEPEGTCQQCGTTAWVEVLRGHENFSDSFRHEDSHD